MHRKSLVIALAIAVMFVATQSEAFDGDRKGFMLNLGAGAGQGKLTLASGGLSVDIDAPGFVSDLKLGGGLSEQVMLYYTNRALWYSPEIAGEEFGTAVNGMSAIGVTYFLEPTSPSIFFSGAIGVGVLTDSDGTDAESGPGATLGVGFEFAKNWIVEATFMGARVAEVLGIDVNISNIAVTVSWLAY